MRKGDNNNFSGEEINIKEDEENNDEFHLIDDDNKNERHSNKNVLEFNELKQILGSSDYERINNSFLKKNSFMLIRDTLENLGI
jgi:hypothetical protein